MVADVVLRETFLDFKESSYFAVPALEISIIVLYPHRRLWAPPVRPLQAFGFRALRQASCKTITQRPYAVFGEWGYRTSGGARLPRLPRDYQDDSRSP